MAGDRFFIENSWGRGLLAVMGGGSALGLERVFAEGGGGGSGLRPETGKFLG